MAGRLTLTTTSPAQSFTEPLTASEVTSYLEIPSADTTRDSDVALWITAARQVAEYEQGRDLVSKQYDLTLDYFPCGAIELRDHLSAVSLVQYTDSDDVDHTLAVTTGYIMDTRKGCILPPYGEDWPSFTPWPSSAVLVRFTVTPPAVDQLILNGMKYLISQWYHNRIPFELGASDVQEYPYSVRDALRAGRKAMV